MIVRAGLLALKARVRVFSESKTVEVVRSESFRRCKPEHMLLVPLLVDTKSNRAP